jgi:hypothetical protein
MNDLPMKIHMDYELEMMMVGDLDIDHSKWEAPHNRLQQRSHSTEKQVAMMGSQLDRVML